MQDMPEEGWKMSWLKRHAKNNKYKDKRVKFYIIMKLGQTTEGDGLITNTQGLTEKATSNVATKRLNEVSAMDNKISKQNQ